MAVSPSSLWLQTGLAMLAVVIGVLLHLKWHPLRRHLSDAWDLMTGMPWLTILSAALMLMAEVAGERWVRPAWSFNELLVWRDVVQPLFLEALLEEARMMHGLLPVWPVALLLPLALVLLSWRVIRFPYRYGPRRQQPCERWLLTAGMVLSWGWILLEIAHVTRPVPEWLETLRLALRAVFSAVTMALSQVMLIRLVIAWEEPEHPDDQKDIGLAAEHTFARWRSLVGLAALDLLWLMLLQAQESPGGLSRGLLIEAMLLFLAMPLAVARVPGPMLDQGAKAMRILGRAFLPLLGMTVTVVLLLMLTRYASALIQGMTGPGTWLTLVLLPLHALVLATVRNWVFLACVFTLLRHGFKPSPQDVTIDLA
jgi:hypothetical protein